MKKEITLMRKSRTALIRRRRKIKVSMRGSEPCSFWQ
jgi:hypothetical protein